MNLQSLLERTRAHINEPIPGFWTDAELTGHLNVAVSTTGVLISSYRDRFYSTTFCQIVTQPPDLLSPSGYKTYALPPFARTVVSVEWIPGDGSNPVRLPDLGFPTEARYSYESGRGRPCGYLLRGTAIDIEPTPDAAYKIKIWYDRFQSQLVAPTDSPLFPEEFQDMIPLYAAVMALIKQPGAIARQTSSDLMSLYERRRHDLTLAYGSAGMFARNRVARGFMGA